MGSVKPTCAASLVIGAFLQLQIIAASAQDGIEELSPAVGPPSELASAMALGECAARDSAVVGDTKVEWHSI